MVVEAALFRRRGHHVALMLDQATARQCHQHHRCTPSSRPGSAYPAPWNSLPKWHHSHFQGLWEPLPPIWGPTPWPEGDQVLGLGRLSAEPGRLCFRAFHQLFVKISNAWGQRFLFSVSSICCRKEHSLSGKATRGTVCIETQESLVVNLQALEPGSNPDSVT